MATVKIDSFGGIQPRVHPSLLQDGMAITARNVKLKSGKLVPLRQPKIVDGVLIRMENELDDIANAKTMHVWEKENGDIEFLLFPGVTWMAGGNIAADDKTRVVISGETGQTFGDSKNAPVIYYRSPNGSRFIHPLCKDALPKPSARRAGGKIEKFDAITMKGYKTCVELDALAEANKKPEKGDVYYTTDGGDIANGGISPNVGSQVVWLGDDRKWGFYDSTAFANLRYTYFFMTWVDELGYESPVSPPSDEVVYNDGETIIFNPIGKEKVDELGGVKSVRVYKVVTGTETGRIQFIAEKGIDEIGNGKNGFQVVVKDEDAGEILTQIESAPDDLRCILKVPGGYYCGFSPSAPKTVAFSDVNLLYSWPVDYRYDIEENIVALAVTSNSVFALTDGYPFVLSGTAPESMSVAKLANPAACVSPRGVCVYGNEVYYVSNAGLMVIHNSADSGTTCSNLTDKIFTKDQWLAKNPSECVMGQHDGALHLFFTLADGTHEGLMIDLNESAAAVTTHDEIAKCVCQDNKTDRMYFVRESGRV